MPRFRRLERRVRTARTAWSPAAAETSVRASQVSKFRSAFAKRCFFLRSLSLETAVVLFSCPYAPLGVANIWIIAPYDRKSNAKLRGLFRKRTRAFALTQPQLMA